MKKEELKTVQVDWFDDHFYHIKYKDANNNEVEEYFPSVTTKLQAHAKPFLGRWRGDVGNREADMKIWETSRRGSRIHLAWDVMTTGGVILFNPLERKNYKQQEIDKAMNDYDGNVLILDNQAEMYDVLKLKRWHEVLQPEVLKSESNVYSLKYKEAGQVDKIVRLKEGEYEINGATKLKLPGGVYIVDLKSGKHVDASAYQQTSAYAACHVEMGGETPVGTLIVHTGAQTRTGIEGLATHYRSVEMVREDYKDYRAIATVWDRLDSSKKPKCFQFPSLIKL